MSAGAARRRATPQDLDQRSKWKKSCQRGSDARLHGKRTKEGCDRGSKVGTVYSGRDGEGPVPLKKLKESGRRVMRKISSPGVDESDYLNSICLGIALGTNSVIYQLQSTYNFYPVSMSHAVLVFYVFSIR